MNYHFSWDVWLALYDLASLPSFWLGAGSLALSTYFGITQIMIRDPEILMELSGISLQGLGIIAFAYSGHFPLDYQLGFPLPPELELSLPPEYP